MVNQNSFIFIACRPTGIIAILFWLCVALLLSGDASAANVVQNGDFETSDFTNWSNSGGSVLSTIVYDGTYSANIHVSGSGDPVTSHFSQSIDLTDVDSITFWYYLSTNSGKWSCSYYFIAPVSPNIVVFESSFDPGPIGEWVQYEVNTTSKSGVHVFGVYGSAGVPFPPYSGEISVFFDDFIADYTPPTININTRVTRADTPLTGIIINDEDLTGGFPNENGERYLTPNEKVSKEYIIDLSGNGLQDGFKLEVSASSADVTKLTIDVSNLVSSRNYDVYLDDQWIEKIGEVTEYQYDITSFSSHTLELVHATGEEEDEGGGGSGPITPPDDDEDEIIIEDDVITIGELTITKEEFQLLTVEQIEALNVSQDTKDKLIAIKSINVDWWKIVLGLCLMATVIEGSRKEGNEIIIVVGVIGVIIAAYKLGYFQL